jgi:hypothetical protein
MIVANTIISYFKGMSISIGVARDLAQDPVTAAGIRKNNRWS